MYFFIANNLPRLWNAYAIYLGCVVHTEVGDFDENRSRSCFEPRFQISQSIVGDLAPKIYKDGACAISYQHCIYCDIVPVSFSSVPLLHLLDSIGYMEQIRGDCARVAV